MNVYEKHRPALLRAMNDGGWHTVYDLSREKMKLRSGPIYVLLTSLKDEGLVRVMEGDEAPPRSYYRLTEAGQRAAGN